MTYSVSQFWQSSSLTFKLALGVGLLVIVLLTFGTTRSCVSAYKDRAYQKREAAAELERKELEAERTQLQLEKAQLKGQMAELEAVNESLKAVAVTRRADIVQTVKEIDAIEKEHEQRKQEIETTGGTLSDDALRRELCERLRARGYKLTCSN